MKYTLGLILIVAMSACQNSDSGWQDGKLELTTALDSMSYGYGYTMGRNLSVISDSVDFAAIVAGARAGLNEDQTVMTTKMINRFLPQLRQKVQIAMHIEQQRMGEENKKQGEAFLAENAKREGVITLPSGLQYEILEEGTGPSPKETDEVVTHYRGTLLDGTEFDSSLDREATFKLNKVIKGWTEGIQLMKTGAKWKFYIPSDLAYGARARGEHIMPNSTLIFEVELLKIK